MSWKTDKFQPLRDRAEAKLTPSMRAEAKARQAAIDAVTRALRPEPECTRDDFMDALVYSFMSPRGGKVWAAQLAQEAHRFAGKSAHALIVDDICGVTTGTKSSLTASEVMVKIARVEEVLRRQAEEAKAIAEVTRELRGEPDPVLDYMRPMRYSYDFERVVTKPSSVVCIDGT